MGVGAMGACQLIGCCGLARAISRVADEPSKRFTGVSNNLPWVGRRVAARSCQGASQYLDGELGVNYPARHCSGQLIGCCGFARTISRAGDELSRSFPGAHPGFPQLIPHTFGRTFSWPWIVLHV